MSAVSIRARRLPSNRAGGPGLRQGAAHAPRSTPPAQAGASTAPAALRAACPPLAYSSRCAQRREAAQGLCCSSGPPDPSGCGVHCKVKGPRTLRAIRFCRACTTSSCSLLRTCGPKKLLERPSSLKSVRAWHQGLETSFLFSSLSRDQDEFLVCLQSSDSVDKDVPDLVRPLCYSPWSSTTSCAATPTGTPAAAISVARRVPYRPCHHKARLPLAVRGIPVVFGRGCRTSCACHACGVCAKPPGMPRVCASSCVDLCVGVLQRRAVFLPTAKGLYRICVRNGGRAGRLGLANLAAAAHTCGCTALRLLRRRAACKQRAKARCARARSSATKPSTAPTAPSTGARSTATRRSS